MSNGKDLVVSPKKSHSRFEVTGQDIKILRQTKERFSNVHNSKVKLKTSSVRSCAFSA